MLSRVALAQQLFCFASARHVFTNTPRAPPNPPLPPLPPQPPVPPAPTKALLHDSFTPATLYDTWEALVPRMLSRVGPVSVV